MSESASRFTPQNKTTQQRLSTTTVGLVALSDFRKRRAEVIEQQEREAREAQLGLTATNTPPDRSLTATPNNASDTSEGQARKKKKRAKAAASAKLSFGGEEEEETSTARLPKAKLGARSKDEGAEEGNDGEGSKPQPRKLAANASVSVVPRALTKSALRKEAVEREALRKEFLILQTAVKASEIAIPFVFYDGSNIPGGTVTVKKGDFIWVFLDKSRKVGAELGVGGDKNVNARREWARVGVDDLMMVRGTVIIPHHYEFYFFILNKTMGPSDRLLFDYSTEAPTTKETADGGGRAAGINPPPTAAKHGVKDQSNISALEGAADDPTFTKVVDRRWYERNKHIYPASIWREFDPEKDYRNEIRRDLGGNAFFFAS